MSANSTSSSNSSLFSVLLNCSSYSLSILLDNAYNFTRVVILLPLSIFILHMGHRQWRQQRSFKTMSHFDIFTYHNAAMELICNVGSIVQLCGIYCHLYYMKTAGYWIFCLIFSGETFFHILTCVERYLAVVHPLTYMRLRNARGIRIRNISIGFAWLLSFVWSSIATVSFSVFPTIHVFCILVFSVVVVSFCSLSVMCVLIRPAPGEGGRDGERVDQTKQRAFLTIMAITGVLWLWFVGFLVCFAVGLTQQCENVSWVVRVSGFCFSLPSSLVLPVLYLYRMGKRSCCGYNRR